MSSAANAVAEANTSADNGTAASQSHAHSHSHSHSHGQVMSASKPGDLPEPSPAALLWTRVGILTVLGLVLYITVCFCTGVYYDRESAFRSTLNCSETVMREAGMEHWLQNGTLLGATRLGRFILWDADLDYGVLVRDGDAGGFAAVSATLDARCFGYRSTERAGSTNAQYRVWRKCTHRLCAEFHETVVQTRPAATVAEVAVTGDGASPLAELYPLQPCQVAAVETVCPHNAPYYLAQAYGTEWLTAPLTKLF